MIILDFPIITLFWPLCAPWDLRPKPQRRRPQEREPAAAERLAERRQVEDGRVAHHEQASAVCWKISESGILIRDLGSNLFLKRSRNDLLADLRFMTFQYPGAGRP